MIFKIANLTSIGKYQGYIASGDVAFKKLTLIYSDNGTGKTTLTSVFRSANQNEPGLLFKRKTFNQTTAQAAQIVYRGNSGDVHHTFHHTNGWTTPIDDIEIFDTHFVNENIYSGFHFNDDHKKQLHEFVIGAQSVSLRSQIEQNKANKSAARIRIKGIEGQIIQGVANGLTEAGLSQFLRLQPSAAVGIDAKISAAQVAVTNAAAQAVINTLPLLSPIATLGFIFDFGQGKLDFAATSEALQNETLETLFNDHCADLETNKLSSPENWLKTGFSVIVNKQQSNSSGIDQTIQCPFCARDIETTNDLLRAYAGKFNEAFNQLLLRLEKHKHSLNAFNIDVVLERINRTVNANSSAVTSWTTHITSANTPQQIIIADETDFKQKLQTFIDALASKIAVPTSAVADQCITDFEAELSIIEANIVRYNAEVAQYNRDLNTFKSTIPQLAVAYRTLDELKRIKKRFETQIAGLCTNLTTEKQALQTLDTTYDSLIQQEQTAAGAFFTTYQTKVNHYLTSVFRTGFTIDRVSNVSPQGKATSSKLSYRLNLHGHPLSFDDSSANSVREALSEGDKSTIALAFFLAKLEIDSNLANKIIVFDDPLSSFDRNRKGYTIEVLFDLFSKVKQIIVLSHNEYFLHSIDKKFGPADKKSLRIFENYTTKASSIEGFDLNILVENKYFKHVKALTDFVSTPDLSKKDTVLSWIRNVLESFIGFKFVRQMAHLPHSQHTLGTFIQELINQNIPFQNNASRAAILAKLNTLNGISMSLHHGNSSPGTTQPIDTSTMTATELVNYIQDTFSLIESDL